MAVLPLSSSSSPGLPQASPAAGRPPRRAAGVAVLAAVLLVHFWAAGWWQLPARPLPDRDSALQVVRIETMARPQPAGTEAAAAATATLAPPVQRPDRQSVPALVHATRPGAAASAPPPPQARPRALLAQAVDVSPPAGARASSMTEQEAVASTDETEAEAMSMPAGAAPPPLYATQLPASAQLLFNLQRGPLSGQAQLTWQQDGQRYQMRFVAQARRGPPIFEQHSTGQLDGNGLAPERFTDRRRARGTQAANFQRDTGRISFSGPRVDYPAWAGAQDRLGTLVQLAAIYNAAAQPPAEVTLFVVGARGGAGLWTFRLMGNDSVVTPFGELTALYLRREPERREDLRVEVWLDPARSHWPVRIRSTPMRGGDPLELTLAAEPGKP